MRPVELVGLGSGPADLTPAARRAVDRAGVLVGGRRHLDFFADHPGRRLVLKAPLEEVLDQIAVAAGRDQRVVVLVSGDPGFFGLGRRLVERLGPEAVLIRPNVTLVQVLAARLKLAWQDLPVLSLHGRSPDGLEAAELSSRPVFVYTDPRNSPARIGRWLVERGQAERRLVIAERLGAPEERIRELSAAQAAEEEFDPLNLVLLRPVEPPGAEPCLLGNPEEAFDHEAGLITKAEVRAVALSLLKLRPGLSLWDLGAGSGALAVEAAGLVAPGRVAAVERRPGRAAQIEANRARFGRDNLSVHRLDLPDGLEGLEPPDRVFVGGGGAGLDRIIPAAAGRLKPGGIAVVSVITLESLSQAWQSLEEAGLRPEASQVQINRFEPIAGRRRLAALNPVFLLRGSK